MVAGAWAAPNDGDTLTLPDGQTRTWQRITPDAQGWFARDALRRGYAYVSLESPTAQVAILEAVGHSLVYVNGEPRAGDPYSQRYVRLPVQLRAGRNDLLFVCQRGGFSARLTPAAGPAALNMGDVTAPDLLVGEDGHAWIGVPVLNQTTDWLKDLNVTAVSPDGEVRMTPLPPIPPLTLRKAPVRVSRGSPPDTTEVAIQLLLTRGEAESPPLDTASLTLRVRAPHETRKVTFISEIDGSVQYYAVNPLASQPHDDAEQPGAAASAALILSLHGASVEAIGQADSYAAKDWAHLVAPTNRRPFGFDWEDWGRLDAVEVLELVTSPTGGFGIDPRRVYLTGHSMGGHGTWQLGAHFAPRFAAIGPSAGWISFQSYAGAEQFAEGAGIEEMLRRATAASDTLSLARNYASLGVYVLHGEADDNVPVEQARSMAARLAELHGDFAFFSQPNAGHWWDVHNDRPGADCVDWAPMMSYFREHALPDAASMPPVDFTTVNPGVASTAHWVTIEALVKPMLPGRVTARFVAAERKIVCTAENIARLSLDLTHVPPGDRLTFEINQFPVGDVDHPDDPTRRHVLNTGDAWVLTEPMPASHKGPHRYGPFKDAFRRNMMFVYGTQGTPEENAWAFAKARYDAETFWYRGNGAIDVLPDTEFDAAATRDRNVILYGQREMNAAWAELLSGSPVDVRRGAVAIGGRVLEGADLACLYVYPRADSDVACVAVVAGSGSAGLRLTDRIPYFVSGVGLPDCLVLESGTLASGVGGVRAAGFFGNDWSIERGEFAWRD